MAMELLFNVVLILFFAFSYYYVGTTMPKSPETELGAEQWPQLLIIALIVLLFINVYNIYKNTPKEKRNMKSITDISITAIFKSKLFWGIIIVSAYSLALEWLGFIASTIIMFASYSKLQGQKNVKVIAITTILITFGVYFVFSRGLGIMLPRGYGFLRDFALFLESF